MNNRILIFTDNFPYGKSEAFLETELDYISQSFEIVSVFPFEIGKDKKIREIPEKIEVMKPVFNEVKKKTELFYKGFFNASLLLKLFQEGMRSKVWKSGTKFRIWVTHFLVIRSLLNEIKQRDLINFFNQFDILYFYWGLRWSQILPFLPQEIRAKIVVRFHGSDLYEHTNNYYIPWRYEQLCRIDKAIAVSETGKKYIENQYPFLKEKIVVSRIGTKDYGINTYNKSETVRIVSCSNLVTVKRVELIAKTLALLKIPACWIHFGTGQGISVIYTLIKQLPGHIKAELKGAVEHEEVMDYYRTTPIDLFLNVSSSEGVPVSVMEAMSFGIPVIATNVGGTSEIVSDKTGLRVNADISPEELAEKIEELTQRNDFIDLRSASRKEWEKKSMAVEVYPEFVNQLLSL
jgi:colanic acid/amylovoran biosynthesis glycosyltransferase